MNYLDAAIVRPIERLWNTSVPETLPDLSWVGIGLLAGIIVIVVYQVLLRVPEIIVTFVRGVSGTEDDDYETRCQNRSRNRPVR